MTSVLNVDTIADKAGTGPVALTKQHAAKAWCKWNSSVTVDNSFNQSSMVDVGTGDYEVVFTNSFGSASSFAAGSLGGQYGVGSGFMSWTGGGNNNTHTDRIKVQFQNSSGTNTDVDKNSVIVHGDLA